LFESHVIDSVQKTKNGIAAKAHEEVNHMKKKYENIIKARTDEYKKSIQSMASLEGQLIQEIQQSTQKQQVLTHLLNERNTRR